MRIRSILVSLRRMSGVASATLSTEQVEISYLSILNKRIRAYKKKVDRINALQGKKVSSDVSIDCRTSTLIRRSSVLILVFTLPS